VAGILIDSDVLLDLFTEDSEWENWSEAMLADLARTSHLVINVAGLTLLTRDARRYSTYFPKLKLIAP
jgi:predicted nucleic acid-binding protein